MRVLVLSILAGLSMLAASQSAHAGPNLGCMIQYMDVLNTNPDGAYSVASSANPGQSWLFYSHWWHFNAGIACGG